MGCGKSSVGREIASRLGCPFTDLDEFIEKQQGRSVAEIFSSEGEAGFRAIELEALADVISGYEGGTMYLSLGGGTLTIPDARPILRACTRVVYLRASVDTLVANLTLSGLSSRPLLSGLSSRPLLSGLSTPTLSTPALGPSSATVPGSSVRPLPAETAIASDCAPSSAPSCVDSAASVPASACDDSATRTQLGAVPVGRPVVHPAGRPVVDVVDEDALRRRVEALLSERSALYEETADVVIDIDGLSTPAIADRLLALSPDPSAPA